MNTAFIDIAQDGTGYPIIVFRSLYPPVIAIRPKAFGFTFLYDKSWESPCF